MIRTHIWFSIPTCHFQGYVEKIVKNTLKDYMIIFISFGFWEDSLKFM